MLSAMSVIVTSKCSLTGIKKKGYSFFAFYSKRCVVILGFVCYNARIIHKKAIINAL
jgi:hypothetical protein